MGTVDWEAFRAKLKQRARFSPGYVVSWRGRKHRINGRYWRQRADIFLYDLREIGPDGSYVRAHHKVPEAELQG